MNRYCLIVAGALLVGCGSHNDQTTSTTQAPAMPATAPAAPVAAPAVPGPIPPPVADAAVFECTQDGKIYVFGFVDHMLAFQHAGKNQPVVIEKPDFTPKHTTVVIEAADDAMAAEILSAYLKLHPEDKK
jgi:hypothetical protein